MCRYHRSLREELAASFKPFITLWNALAQWVTADTQQCSAHLRGDAAAPSTKNLEASQALVKVSLSAVSCISLFLHTNPAVPMVTLL